MKLELCTFAVEDVLVTERTYWSNGILEVNLEELAACADEDPRVEEAEIFVARPGDSVRILPIHDVVEPRGKVSGNGTTYPGLDGRPTVAVGSGRSHRLSGAAVAECAVLPGVAGVPGTESQPSYFLDMSGPAALEPYASLYLICVKVGLADGLSGMARAEAAWNATLRVSDRLVEATRQCEPTDVGVFELPECDRRLPRVIYFSFYYSPEHYAGSPTAFGTSIYGLSRLTPPWFLHPNELLDGAIARATMFTSTWLEVNNPVLLDLYDAHGRDLAFSGVIAQRTRWTSQTDKDLTASQAVKLAARLGASGAIVTWDSGGNDFVEVATTISLCEQSGIRTILLTPDECRTGVLGATMLFLPPEADAIVTTGAVRLDDVPKPQTLIGFEEGLDQDVAVPMARPVYGQDDFYGLRTDSAFDY